MKRIKRIMELPGDVYREIKFAVQRVRRGYSARDVWSFDDWFLNVIPNMLRDLSEMECGYSLAIQPEFYEKHSAEFPVPLNALIYFGDQNDERIKAPEELVRKFDLGCGEYWKSTLIKMAEILDNCREAPKKYSDYRERDKVREDSLKEFSQLFVKYFEDLWA